MKEKGRGKTSALLLLWQWPLLSLLDSFFVGVLALDHVAVRDGVCARELVLLLFSSPVPSLFVFLSLFEHLLHNRPALRIFSVAKSLHNAHQQWKKRKMKKGEKRREVLLLAMAERKRKWRERTMQAKEKEKENKTQ